MKCCSKAYGAWETLVLVAIVANCIISTFKAAFESTWLTSWVIAYVCDLIVVVNTIVSFYVTHIDKRGIYVTSCDTISRMYVRKMFVWDVLSVLPTDLIIFIPGFPMAYRRWRIVAALRTNRLFGLHRVFRFTGMNFRFTGMNFTRI